jgi:Cu+-exporting ATPase
MLITFILLGKYFETLAKGRTSEAIQKLMSLQPPTATLLEIDSKGEVATEKEIPIDLVQRGDILKLVPGSKVPTDGVVISGLSSVNEAMITGEAMPVHKKPGDHVIGGTINQTGLLRMKATRVGADTGLAQIIKLIQDAQTSKAPIQNFADKVAGVFVPFVVAVAFVTFVIWLIISTEAGIPVQYQTPGTSPFLFSLLFCISVIVIACPCALGLATPTAIMVGTGIGAANGILIKGGAVLEIAHKISAIIFDKTGTLTYGRPNVTETRIFTKKMKESEVYRIVGSAEKGSEHPLAAAIVRFAEDQSLKLVNPEKFEV